MSSHTSMTQLKTKKVTSTQQALTESSCRHAAAHRICCQVVGDISRDGLEGTIYVCVQGAQASSNYCGIYHTIQPRCYALQGHTKACKADLCVTRC